MLCCFLSESSPNLLKMQDEVFSCLRVWEVRFSVGLTPVLVRRQPSSEAIDSPSEVARSLYRDGA